MKLRIEKGPLAGKTFDLEAALITIGRASDNDIVIKDELVSQHHVKIWRDLDGHISLTDMGSVNGTEVNGRLVQTVELRSGDRVVIGKTVMRLVEDVSATKAPSAIPTPAPQIEGASKKKNEATIDLGFERKNKSPAVEPASTEKGGGILARPSKLLLTVLIIAVLAVGGALLVKVLMSNGNPKSVRVANQPLPQQADVEFYFENVEGIAGAPVTNLRRISVHLKGNKMTMEFDDLAENIRRRKEKQLSTEKVQEFLGGVKIDLLEREAPETVRPSDRKSFSELDIRVTRGSDYFQRVVRNTLPPQSIVEAKTFIEGFLQREFDQFVQSRERLKILAGEAFQKAEREIGDVTIREEALFKAIEYYKEVLRFLDGMENEPLYEQANIRRIKAEERLNQDVNELMQKAEISRNQNAPQRAKEFLLKVMKMVPDKKDPRHKRAYDELIKLEMN